MKTGQYRHYSGNHYQVLGVVQHTETRQKMVLYRALYECPDLVDEYGEFPCFVRPFDMFHEDVEHGGRVVPRFEYIAPV